ncbi:MAG: hypothetical protein ABI318_14230 [Chthoniobacteraceae bacterium]
MVTSILDKSAQVEALEGALELEKAELIAIAKPFYFAHHHGQHAVVSSVEARAADGKVVRVGFSNSYRGTSDEPAITRLAGEHAAGYFKQPFELKIEGDVIPEVAVEPLLAELQKLFARHGASAALSAKSTIKTDEGVCQRPPTLPCGQRLRPSAVSLRSVHAVQRRAEPRTRQGCAHQREREDEARTRRERR